MRESLASAEPNFCIEVNGEMPNFRNKTAILKTSTVRSLFCGQNLKEHVKLRQ
jgi:hypothetical protein